MSLTPWENLDAESPPQPPRRPVVAAPLVTFLVATTAGTETLAPTLGALEQCGLRPEEFEIRLTRPSLGSRTTGNARGKFPLIDLLAQGENCEPPGLASVLGIARGKYLFALDGHCRPVPGSVAAMVQRFEVDDRLAAAVFTVSRPDGTRHVSGYPNLLVANGTGFRREAVEQVGGFPAGSMTDAADYDLSLRLLAGGWRIKPFDDLRITEVPPAEHRISRRVGVTAAERSTRQSVEKQLSLATRYFPRKWIWPFASDWMRRHRLIAKAKGHDYAYYGGVVKGLLRALQPAARRPINDRTFELLVKLEETRLKLQRAQDKHRFRRVLFLDLGANMLSFWRAARDCGLQVVGIADPVLSGTGRRYRGIPLVSDEAARKLDFDAAVVCHVSPIWSAERRARWASRDTRPVIELFDGETPPMPIRSLTFERRAGSGVHRTAARTA